MRPFTATTALGALALAAAFAAGPAKAADDDRPLDSRILGAILEGVGLERDKAPIDYHERPPLVIPPSKMLPPPEKADAIASNPAWPKDPDVLRSRAAAEHARKGTTSEEIEQWSRPLLPDQIAPGPKSTKKVVRYDQNYTPTDEKHPQLLPSQLGYNGGLLGIFKSNDKPVHFTGEPTRTELTEPPPGYQTPSPEQPYGPGGAGPVKAENYLEKHGTEGR